MLWSELRRVIQRFQPLRLLHFVRNDKLSRPVLSATVIALIALASFDLFIAKCEARELGVLAEDVALIKPSLDSDEARFLARFPLPDVLIGRSIDFASLSFGAISKGVEEKISFQAFSVTTSWEGRTVSWVSPWEKAGGDWDALSSAYSLVEIGSGEKNYLDVTDFVNDWLSEPSKNFGLLIKVSGPFFGSFSWEPSQGLPVLRVLY